METGNNFPWEVLKADCLRLICYQVCATSEVGGVTNSFGKREEMISFLRDVTERGLDTALTAFGESRQSQRSGRETTSSVKRKDNDDDIEDQDADGATNADEAPITPNSHQAYNTRFKGVKRVKLGREIPEGFPYTPHRRVKAPRKGSPVVLTSGSQTNENGAVKRKRGRPRKLGPRLASAEPVTPGRPPTSGIKQVFDGVVVMKRAHPSKRPELEDTAASHLDLDADADADAEGDMDGEIIGPDSGSLQLNGFIDVAGENHYDSNQGDPSAP